MSQLVQGENKDFREYKSKNNRAILKAEMFRLFLLNGYAGTGIRDACHSNRGMMSTLYYHFGSKQGLMLSVMSDFLADCRLRLASMAQLERIADPRKRLQFHYLWLMMCLRNHPELGQFYHRLRSFDIEDLQREKDKFMQELHEACLEVPRGCVRELCRLGVCARDEQQLLGRYLLFAQWSSFELISEERHPSVRILNEKWQFFCRMELECRRKTVEAQKEA